jgi:hypothetical protein
MPVPNGMTPDEVWHEVTTLGRLAETPPQEGLQWALYECAGGDRCRCRFIDRSANWRRFHNDRLVAAKVCGLNVPRYLLPLVSALSRRP